MILAVDIGNTNISVAVFGKDGEISLTESFPDNMFHSPDEFYNKLLSMGLDIEGAVLCSVVPSLGKMAETALRKLTDGNVTVIDSNFSDGMRISGYDRKKLGNDRIADMTAAKVLYGTPAVVVDMGTATTFSVISKDGVFIGGMIIPGLGLSLNALSSGTALLPGIKPYAPNSLLGQDTVSCINNGVIYAEASAIEGIVSRVEEKLGERVNTVITGGAAKFILPILRTKAVYDEHLLFKGLKILYEQGEKS